VVGSSIKNHLVGTNAEAPDDHELLGRLDDVGGKLGFAPTDWCTG